MAKVEPPDLVVVGQATIDDIHREGEGLISPGTPGGDSVYAVLGATVWPIKVGVVTCVGSDYPRDKLAYATCNPDLTDWSGLSIYDGPSIHDEVLYYKDGRRTYTFEDPKLLDVLSPGPHDVPATMKECRHVHLAPENATRQMELVRYFRQKGAMVSLDIESHFVNPNPAIVYEMLQEDPIFIPSLEHVQQLSGTYSRDPLELWPWIKSCGASMVVVKCGEDGAWVFDVNQNLLWQVGVVPDLKIDDVTGAGDSYCGGFMAGMILTQNPVQAAAYGAVSASFIVESLGAVRPPTYKAEIAEERLQHLLQRLPGEPVDLS